MSSNRNSFWSNVVYPPVRGGYHKRNLSPPEFCPERAHTHGMAAGNKVPGKLSVQSVRQFLKRQSIIIYILQSLLFLSKDKFHEQ